MNAKVELLTLPWKTLSRVDSHLLEKYVESENLRPRKIPLDCTNSDETDSNAKVSQAVQKFLDEQYQQSLRLVTFELVPYLPSESFTQIDSFRKQS